MCLGRSRMNRSIGRSVPSTGPPALGRLSSPPAVTSPPTGRRTDWSERIGIVRLRSREASPGVQTGVVVRLLCRRAKWRLRQVAAARTRGHGAVGPLRQRLQLQRTGVHAAVLVPVIGEEIEDLILVRLVVGVPTAERIRAFFRALSGFRL
eukprot:1526204-Pyramimonas_sp.AAC.1